MSVFAEYAAELHKKVPLTAGERQKFCFDLSNLSPNDTQAAIFDVYGTLINVCGANFASEDEKKDCQAGVFLKTAQEFNFVPVLEKIDNSAPPQITLANFYGGLLLMLLERDEKAGRKFSEPQVFEVWNTILAILARNGYDIDAHKIGERDDFAKCIAYFFHFHSFSRTALFDGCTDCLLSLKKRGTKLGLLANTQFFTTLELSLLLRDEGVCEDYLDLFDDELCFFSYDVKMSKQSGELHKKLFDTLYDLKILPANVLFASADPHDLDYARKIGMKTPPQ